MSDGAGPSVPSIVPAMLYRDAPAAIDWLCEAFGFERHLVVPGEGGTVRHAQLVLGHGMVMLGSARDEGFGLLMRPPAELGGIATQSVYVIVEDADQVYQRAVAAGAEVVVDIKDEEYGGRGFSCRDPEGHLWSFGTYDPWAA